MSQVNYPGLLSSFDIIIVVWKGGKHSCSRVYSTHNNNSDVFCHLCQALRVELDMEWLSEETKKIIFLLQQAAAVISAFRQQGDFIFLYFNMYFFPALRVRLTRFDSWNDGCLVLLCFIACTRLVHGITVSFCAIFSAIFQCNISVQYFCLNCTAILPAVKTFVPDFLFLLSFEILCLRCPVLSATNVDTATSTWCWNHSNNWLPIWWLGHQRASVMAASGYHGINLLPSWCCGDSVKLVSSWYWGSIMVTMQSIPW